MFPEGTTSNGTHILKFRKGAFYGEKRVRPVILKYREMEERNIGTVSPAYEVIEYLPLCVMQLSLPPFWFFCRVISLPEFEPNEYLYEKHKDRGNNRWEIYAWAIRDIMMNQGGFKECNLSWKHKD